MNYVTLLGYFAAVTSTASFAPQAWKIVKSRQTKDISTGMYLLTVLGFALWLLFGLLEKQWPLVASNGVCLMLSAFILIMKLLPKRQKEEVADVLSERDREPVP